MLGDRGDLMQKLILVVACFSLVWNYSIPKRYMKYEEGNCICGRRQVRLLFLKLSGRAGQKIARITALLSLFFTWFILCGYFTAITASFNANGMKVVAMVTAVFATITIWQDMAYVYHNFVEWCYNQEDNIIVLAKGCWEIVLAALVVINIFIVT